MSPNQTLDYHPRIHIAVDKLEIVDGPALAQLAKSETTYSAEKAVKVRFTVITPASNCPTVVKARVWDGIRVPTTETEFDYEPTPSGDWQINCLIGGWRFFGTYNPTARTGTLHAEIWDPDDPTDGRNWD